MERLFLSGTNRLGGLGESYSPGSGGAQVNGPVGRWGPVPRRDRPSLGNLRRAACSWENGSSIERAPTRRRVVPLRVSVVN